MGGGGRQDRTGPTLWGQKMITHIQDLSCLQQEQNNHMPQLSMFPHVSACVYHCPNQFQSIPVTLTPRQPGMGMALMDTALTTQSSPLTRNDFDAVTSTIKRGQMAHWNANRSLSLSGHISGYWTNNQVHLFKRFMNQILQTDISMCTHARKHTHTHTLINSSTECDYKCQAASSSLFWKGPCEISKNCALSLPISGSSHPTLVSKCIHILSIHSISKAEPLQAALRGPQAARQAFTFEHLILYLRFHQKIMNATPFLLEKPCKIVGFLQAFYVANSGKAVLNC